MSTLSKVLKNNIDTSCILLHGDVTDMVISKDLCFREFNVVLTDVLREHGFDNVVFFDATNALGKFVYDDRSAYHSIESSREPYEKKYKVGGAHADTPAETPAGAPSGNPTPQPGASGAPSAGRIKVFGRPRVSAGGAGAPSSGGAGAPPAGGTGGTSVPSSVGTSVPSSVGAGAPSSGGAGAPPAGAPSSGGDGIIYQQRNLIESSFYGESTKFLENTEYRTAIVFPNINILLQRKEFLDRYYQIIQNRHRNSNLIVFINPDSSSNPEADREFIQLMKSCSLTGQFYDEKSPGVYTPHKGRVFGINSLAQDEIRYLLSYYCIFREVDFADGIDVAAEKISYIIRSINSDIKDGRKITLRGLKARMDAILEESSSRYFDDSFMERLLDCNINDYEFDPWRVLKSRHGWENVVKQIENMLKGIGNNQNLTKSSRARRNTLLVERLEGCEGAVFPSAAKLPHMIIEGSPGVGKTTVAKHLGRLLHDYGWLSVGHVVMADKSALIGEHIGSTAIKVQRLLDKAENGVLFIDEAYSLCEDYEKEGNAAVFAKEAVDTLVNAMTDETRHVVVIFSGYRSSTTGGTDGVNGLKKMNEGLDSRIKYTLTIDDYDPKVLTEIFFSVLKEKGYELGEDLNEETVRAYMNTVYQMRDRRTFGNGRFVKETLIERKLIPNARERGDERFIVRADFADEIGKLENPTKESIYAELDKYPGLDKIGRRIIEEYIDLRQMQIDDGKDLDDIKNIKHLVFVGSPGVGKTTVANLLCKSLGVAQLMSGIAPVEVKNPESITKQELELKIKDAVNYNTILLVDEAHNCPPHILHSLLNPMSENKKLTCVFCVYSDREKEFFEKDQGLESRTGVYHIDDYTPEQLMQIFKAMAKKEKKSFTDELLDDLAILLRNWYENRLTNPKYANARDVREKLLDPMMLSCYRRNKDSGLSHDERSIMTVEDIPEEYREVIKSQGRTRGLDEILENINAYYGWEDLKSWLINAKNQMIYNESRPSRKIIRNHMRFVGDPGTGKSTAGELFAEAAYAMGLIPSKKFRSCTAKDLIAGFVGQTHSKADAVFRESLGGVLFIDEAHALDCSDSFGNADQYKKDVVCGLLTFAENNRDRVIIILAGYEDEMNKMLKSDDGLGSRFPDVIRFRNFGPEASIRILRSMLEKDYAVTSELESIAAEYFSVLCARGDYANGRDIRTISGNIIKAVIDRVVNSGVDAEDSVTVPDVRAGFEAFMATKK